MNGTRYSAEKEFVMASVTRLRRTIAALLVALTSLVLPASAEVPTALNLVDPKQNFPDVSRAYSAMDERYARTGNERSIEQVRRVTRGMDKRGLINALGQPVAAYPDGSWLMNLSLVLENENRLICQYRVWFDEEERVVGSVWRRPQCADLVLARTK